MQRPPAYSRREGGRRAPVREGPPRRGGRGRAAAGHGLPRRAALAATATAPRSRSSARPGPTSASWSPIWATPTARSSSGPRSAPFQLADADPERLDRRSTRRSRSCPSAQLDADEARLASNGMACAVTARTTATGDHVRLTHDGELVAIAEPRAERAQARRSVRAVKVTRSAMTSSPGRAARARSRSAPSTACTSGHREVIRGNDTVLTFDPHPLVGDPARRPRRSCCQPFADQARPDRRARGRGAGGDPVRPRLRGADAPSEFVDDVLVGQLGRHSVSVGENFRFGRGAQGNAELLALDGPSSRRASCRWWRSRGRRSSSSHIRGLVRPATCAGAPSSSAARSCSRARSSTATSAAASSACRPPTSCPTTRSSCPGHGVYAAWAHGHPAAVNVGVRPDLRDRPRPADRGLPDRLRGRPLRRDAADRVRRADARREALRVRRGARGADAADVEQAQRDLRARSRADAPETPSLRRSATFPAA